MSATACRVCKGNLAKYKCSACYSPYCSLNCYKKHKNGVNCKAKEKSLHKSDISKSTDRQKYFTEDTVSDDKLRQLGDSETLKKMLSNKYLQSTLMAIDDASNPEDTLKQAMKDPEFVEFVDECLKLVEESPGCETCLYTNTGLVVCGSNSTVLLKSSLSVRVSGLPRGSLMRLKLPERNFWIQYRAFFSLVDPSPNAS